MPDECSPVQHDLVLGRVDPEQGIWRFYSLMAERDLFGTVRLVRNWGRSARMGKNWSRCLTRRTGQGRRRRGY